MRILIVIMIIMCLSVLAYANEQYDVTKATILSFQSAYEAQLKIDTLDSNKQLLDNVANEMICLQYAKHKFQHAKALLDPFATSNNDYIRDGATGYTGGYSVIINVLESRLNTIERLANTSPNEYPPQGTLAKELAEQIAKSDQGWELIVASTKMLQYILVDPTRIEDGKLPYLYITSGQRQELCKQLEFLGVKSDPNAANRPIEVAAYLLWKFLHGDWKSADSKTKGK